MPALAPLGLTVTVVGTVPVYPVVTVVRGPDGKVGISTRTVMYTSR